jgi:DNA invertase Pin-like site-specific DNA recombinase
MVRAIIYARCSTDEKRQDVEVQLKQLREHCDKQGWTYEEHSEYGSGSKQIPDKLRKILKLVQEGHYNIFLVYDLTRFSRLHPTTTTKMMDFISKHCRFISLQDGIDSQDELKWLLIKPMFQYMAWVFSRNLSQKVKLGMERASDIIKERGFYISKKTGKKIEVMGRPPGAKDKKIRSKKGYYKRYEEKLPFEL